MKQKRLHKKLLAPRTIAYRPSVDALEKRQLLSATISFAAHVDFTAGTLPVALAAADFNADGNQDLAVADEAGDKVSVFFGNGGGTFSAGPVLALSSPPVAVITGDFNGDGKPDVAAACTAGIGQSTTSVVVFLNTDSGTFGLGQITSVETDANPGESVALAAGDFNNDGHLDLAVTDYTNEGISILIGNGTGSFAAPDNYQSDAHPIAITDADFNGDTFPDLAVTNTSTDISSGVAVTSNNVGILVGSSTGDFTAGPNISVDSGGLPTSITAGDFTSANTPGLVVGSSDSSATVITNTSGTFAAAAPVALNAGSTSVAVGDFDLDGVTDFVSADGGSSTSTTTNSVTVVPGFGTGTLQFTTGAAPADVVVADFNNDGKPDLATANETGGTVSILLNTTPIPLIKTTTAVAVSATSTPAGSVLTLTATITPASVSPLTKEEVPTGTVNFYDGATLLSTVTLASGVNTASFSTSSLTIGAHKLRAIYGADDAYAASTSAVVAETITPTASEGADLVGAFVSSTLPAIVAPGETGVVKIRVTNQGNSIATGAITNQLYLSLDDLIDSSDTLLSVRGSLAHAAVHLQPSQSVILTGTITIPAGTPLATYSLLTALDATGSLAESVSTNNLVVSPTTSAVSDVFGTVDGRAGITLKATDSNGTPSTLKLTGPGNGILNVGDDGTDLVLDGTTAASVLTITTARGATFSIHDLTADSPIGSLRLSTTSVNNSLSLPGGATAVSLASAGVAGSSFTLGGGTVASLSLGLVNNLSLTTTGGIRTLIATTWTGGSITSPWITTLRSKGIFNANLAISGVGAPAGVAVGSLIAARIVGPDETATGGSWQVTGNIGKLSAASFEGNFVLNDTGLIKSIASAGGLNGTIDANAVGTISVRGTVENLVLNTATTIGTISIIGALETSTINSGINQVGAIASLRVTGSATGDTVTSGYDAATQTILPGGLIKAITITGPVDTTTKFLATGFPKKATLGGVAVDPTTDPHFQS